VFAAPPYLFFSIIYTLPLFPAYVEDLINLRVRRSSKKFGRENIIRLGVRRSLKEFGREDLIRLGFYRMDGRSFVRGGLIRLGYL